MNELAIFAEGYDVEIWEQIVRVVLAMTLGAVIGLERELKNKPAGFITFMLVSMGSCLFALVQVNLIAMNLKNMTQDAQYGLDTSRIVAQIVPGIGFLGAGTILHNKGTAKGITTAALLWVSAAIGLLVGMGGIPNYIIACVTTIVIFPCALLIRKLGRKYVEKHRIYRIDVVILSDNEQDLYDKIKSSGGNIKKVFFHNKSFKNDVSIKELYVYFSTSKDHSYNSVISGIINENYIISLEDS